MESASLWRLDLLARFDVPSNHDARPTLLRVLTELYVQRPTHTADEERHYTELALRLLDTADIATRAAVAQRLAHYGSPPPRVVERLGGDVSSGYAQRQPFRSAASFMRDDGRTDRASIDLDVATTLNELFFAANPDERRLILLNLDVIAPFPAGRMKLSGEESLSGRLEAAVLSRNRATFAQHLAQALHISRAQARRLADDDLGEPIVTAAKALDIRRGALYRILLFVNIGRSVARVQALTELHHELPRQTAEHMVAIWQSLSNVDRPADRHQPLLWEDNASSHPRIASATTQQALLAPPKQRDAC
jgi:uncharacterized protein (DUF2336 family)